MKRDPKSRIASLERGLAFLAVLNAHNGVTANEMATLTESSRGTSYRTLHSLCDQGFLRKDPHSGGYWLTNRVLSLSHGYQNERWITEVAQPHIQSLSRKVLWPVLLGTPSGASMLLRVSTDFESPFARERNLPGNRVSIFDSATGRVFLAFSSSHQRDLVLNLTRGARPLNRAALERHFGEIRSRGYDIAERDGISTLAVPVLEGSRPRACIGMRYFSSALSREKAVDENLAALQSTTRRIAEGLRDLDAE